MSIAYRLRMNEPMTLIIIQLLEGIENSLELILKEIMDVGWKQFIDFWQAFSRVTPETKIIELQEDAKANIDLLLDIATDLRRPGAQREEQRALNFSPFNDGEDDLMEDFKQHVRDQCRLHLSYTRAVNMTPDRTDAHQLAELTSSNLAKFNSELLRDKSLIEATPDPFQKATVAQIIPEVVQLSAIDNNRLISADDEYLLDRLQRTIIQRWRLLCYRSEHGRNLAFEPGSQETHTIDARPNNTLELTKPKDSRPAKQKRQKPTKPGKTQTPRTIISSAATALTANRITLGQSEKEKRPRSISTKCSGVALKDVDLPKEPHIKGRETMCPLCWIPMPAKDVQGTRWKFVAPSAVSLTIC